MRKARFTTERIIEILSDRRQGDPHTDHRPWQLRRGRVCSSAIVSGQQ